MRKPRKVNTIRALKQEIAFYKRQLVPVNVVYKTDLKHIKLSTVFSPQEVELMRKDAISNILVYRMKQSFADYILSLPIETSYDERFNIYKAELDLWVK